MPAIRKVLVANRGEIAIRIFRACRELGISTVAIYSDIDRDALHTKFADEAYFLGGASPSGGYLNIERIVQLALRTEATAVHPGYGFLAENATFAGSVEAAGLIWIGPPPAAIHTMGDKVSARRVAADAGVSAVPGSSEPIEGPEAVHAFAGEYGWPVTLKAAFGGGGRGFRVVRAPEEAAGAFESAAREATAAFGRPELYIERYLEHPRHIEVQLIGDSFGQVVHLGERDCSLQRRHQKLLEESPSPAVGPELRRRICEAAVRIAREARYSSAGTVEFLLEQTAEPDFWFLEMNTRLQVEHPVTEMVTGIDLAKEMIRVAEDRPLSFSQEEVNLQGHAIECRINAEDPLGHFLPSPGVISEYREPAGPWVRVDSGAAAGTEISENYDSLIAKLICWGHDRDEAIKRTLRALNEFRIGGIKTTLDFHRLVVGSEWFSAGEFSTQSIEASLDLNPLRASAVEKAAPLPVHERVVSVEVEGRRYEVRLRESADTAGSRPKPQPPEIRREGSGEAGETILAPMRGTIVRVLTEQGSRVTAGQTVFVLEAMKMENMIVCNTEGTVTELRVTAGDTVSQGAVLAVIEST